MRRGIMAILLLILGNCGYTQESMSFLNSYYRSFIDTYKDIFDGYVFLSDSIAGNETILQLIDEIPASRLPKAKNAVPKILHVTADSVYKGAELNLKIISREEFGKLPHVVDPRFTTGEVNAKRQTAYWDSLIIADEKNRRLYQKRQDSLNKSNEVISYDRKARRSLKRLLTFFPPVIYGQKLVIACVAYHSVTNSQVFYEVYSLDRSRK